MAGCAITGAGPDADLVVDAVVSPCHGGGNPSGWRSTFLRPVVAHRGAESA